MHRLADRYTLELVVELFAEGQRQQVALQDLSRSGMFLHLNPPLPVGTKVRVAISPEGHRFVTTARVTHALDAANARALGRSPGVGLMFCEPTAPHDQLFSIAVERLLRRRRASTSPIDKHIVIADPETRVLERMSTALGEAGFTVATATTGMEALAACLRRTPDVVVIERSLPVLDGFAVLEQIALDPALAAVPVIITSTSPADVAAAFERGAMDFMIKPFTAVEVIARARRLSPTSPHATDRVVLRGVLSDLGLPALLTMLELERKTGRLVVTGDHTAWIDLVDGRILSAGSSCTTDQHAALMTALDWTQGTFELSAVAGPYTDAMPTLSVTHVLLEHARHHDEAAAARTPRASRVAYA